MSVKDYTGIVPDHYEGKPIDTIATTSCDSLEEARQLYQIAKQKLLDVNRWKKVAGTLSADFQLMDAKGKEADRAVQENDFFKIDIPGPGPSSGDGFDWVKVEQVQEYEDENTESIGLRVRPCPSPENNDRDIAHFYSVSSTSSFVVTREGKELSAAVYDRNTKTNEPEDNKSDALRDTAVGAGAIALFSKLQWKSLVNGLVDHSSAK